MRVHGADVANAGYISSFVYGFAGIPGMILGGFWGRDHPPSSQWPPAGGRLGLGDFRAVFFLCHRHGRMDGLAVLFGLGCACLYVYFATVAPQLDVIEPSLRATAMAIYFCFMYLFGGASGPRPPAI